MREIAGFCPTCTSNDPAVRYITALLDENIECVDPWHDQVEQSYVAHIE